MAAGDSGRDDATYAEIEAAIKLQAFFRGVKSRVRVAGMLGNVIDNMLDGNTPPDSGDDGSYDGTASKSDDDNMSLASDDFNAEELQEYLQGKYDTVDLHGSMSEDRIIRPSMRKQSWIIHSPSQERTNLGSWRSNMKDMTKNVAGSVKQRAKMINSTRNLSLDDSAGDLNYHNTPPSQPKVKKIGDTMTKLLSPIRSSDASSKSLKLPIPNPKRKSDLPSPGSRLKVPMPGKARRNSSALMDKVSDYTASVSPKVERKKRDIQVPRRKSEAIMEKVTVFKDFGEKMKHAKDAMTKKPIKKKKENFNIDTHSTPKPRELRKSIEAGLFSQNLELPKIQPLDDTEVEGIQAKIAQLGFDKTAEEPVENTIGRYNRVVDFAAHQYLMHDSATKIQAVARGYLYRRRDQEAMARVQRWLQQNQDIQKALTGDPEDVTEEERAKAVEAFAQEIERLVPPELTRGASKAAGIGASFVVEQLSTRELVRRESGIAHPYNPASFSTLKNSFDAPLQEEEELPEAPGQESTGKKPSVRNRQKQMNEAATIIQACTRGYLVRKSNFGSAVAALNWLKEYKLMAKLEEEKKGIQHDKGKLDGALDAINKVQLLLHHSATKIQAITRGYIVRKFDMKTMVNVMDWVRACKLEMEEEQAPKTEELEDTWIFLENAQRWIRETEKRKSESVGESPGEDVAEEDLDVNELLSTWEFVKRDKSTESSKQAKGDPTENELERMRRWLKESDHPYASSSDDDMHELWEFLGAQSVDVDAFRDRNWDETKSSGLSIEYIDKDLSRFYGKLPSIKALIEFWSFSRKHDIETLAAPHSGETVNEKAEEQPKQAETEPAPESEAAPEADAAPVTETETQPDTTPSKAETKSADTETEEANTVADVASDSEDSVEPLPQPVKKVKRRTATNIDGMMSSLKWLKKKGLDLNRIKGGTSVGKVKSGGVDVAKSGTLAKLGLGSTKSKIPDAGPKMSSALDWLQKKGFDISESVSKQLAEDPTPDEMSEVVKRMSNNKNTQSMKLPTAEEMEQTMKWWKIQQSAKDLKKKQKKKKKDKTKKEQKEKQKEKENEEEDAIAPPALASTDSMQYALNFLQKTGKSNRATGSSSGLEKTVELMQKQVEKKRESETPTIPENSLAESTPSPEKAKQPSETDIYEADVLEWLNTGDEDIKGAAYFAKLDKTLPGKDSHTNEHRAKEIAKAMKWVDKQGFLADKTEPEEKKDIIGVGEGSVTDSDDDTPPKPLVPPKAVKKKVDAKAKKSKKVDTSKSSKNKASKKKESKSRSPSRSRSNSPDDLESRSRSTSKSKASSKKKASKSRSQSRSRSNSPTRSRSTSPAPGKKKKKSKDGKASSKKADLPSVKSMLSPRKKKKTLMKMKTGEQDPERDYELAVAWLTNRDEYMEDAKYFQKLDSMVPQNPDHTLEERARELVKALNWVRRTSEKNKNKEAEAASPKVPAKPKATAKTKSPKTPKRKVKLRRDDEGEKTDRAVLNLKDLVKAQKTRKADNDGGAKKSESTPEQDYENALNFIRIKEEGGDVTECEDCNYFKKLDNMLPKKGTSEERAREMVKMLGWLRKKGKA